MKKIIITFILIFYPCICFSDSPLLFVTTDDCLIYPKNDENGDGIKIDMGKVFYLEPNLPNNMDQIEIYIREEGPNSLKYSYFIKYSCGSTVIENFKIMKMRAEEILATIEDKQKKKKLLSGEVWIGMSKNETLLSWGQPNQINTTILKNKTTEQWCYSLNRYLYFEKDLLTAIQK